MDYYLHVLALHIIFIVCWFAGLFYSVRLFIYHTEANDRPELERKILQDEFTKIEARLWNIITTPAMYLTIIAGVVMLSLNPGLLQAPWMHVKLSFVVLLVLYHFACQNIMKQLRNGIFKLSSDKLRLWNEVATLFLVAIVFMAILKSSVNWIYGLIGFIVFGVALMVAFKWYKRYRIKKGI